MDGHHGIIWRERDGYLSTDFPVPEPPLVGQITIEPRQRYCDRGNFIAKISAPGIDWQDGWPRYYFSLDVAKSECEAFIEKRYGKGALRG